jgi:hypothetical protein
MYVCMHVYVAFGRLWSVHMRKTEIKGERGERIRLGCVKMSVSHHVCLYPTNACLRSQGI